MAPEPDQQGFGRFKRIDQVETIGRSRGAGEHAVVLPEDQDRAPRLFGQARRHRADEAGFPPRILDGVHRSFAPAGHQGHRGPRFRQHLCAAGFALQVDAFELVRQAPRLGQVPGHQQVERQLRTAHPSGRVDPGG